MHSLVCVRACVYVCRYMGMNGCFTFICTRSNCFRSVYDFFYRAYELSFGLISYLYSDFMVEAVAVNFYFLPHFSLFPSLLFPGPMISPFLPHTSLSLHVHFR